MRRISFLVSVVTTSALAIAAIAAGPASATEPNGVFCSTAPASHECGEAAYPAETQVKASLVTPLYFKTGGGTTVMQCTGSTFNMSVGGNPSVLSTTALGFSGCTTTFNVTQLAYSDLKWTEGTDNGTLTNKSLIMINFLGVKCYFTHWTPMKVVGGNSPAIELNNTRIVGMSGFPCPSQLYTNGKYQIESPSPLYVEKP